jgi:hypothetical protein
MAKNVTGVSSLALLALAVPSLSQAGIDTRLPTVAPPPTVSATGLTADDLMIGLDGRVKIQKNAPATILSCVANNNCTNVCC